MAGRLEKKIALITGGCSGIGLETAELYLSEGARVVVADLDVPRGEELEKKYPGHLLFVPCDVTDEGDVKKAVEAARADFGGLNIILNNAGSNGSPDPLESMTVAGWDSTMALLLRSVMLGIKHSIPLLKASGGGAIINTSSVAGLRPGIGAPAYSVAKSAILHLTRVAALEFAPHRIRVNAICPGVIPTPVIASAFGLSRDDFETRLPRITEVAGRLQPISPPGAPRDVAEGCLYLGSDAARFVTGVQLVIDGALTQLTPEGFQHSVGQIVQICS